MAIKFTAKVWMTSVLLTPILIALYLLSQNKLYSGEEVLFTIGAITAVGFVGSLPNFILLFIFVWLLQNRPLAIENFKMLINIFAVLITVALFYFTNLRLDKLITDSRLILFYSFTLTAGIWFYSLRMYEPKH